MVTMMFVDRLFLSNYSLDALNAATSSGTLFWAGAVFWISFVSIGEVFVAQYNGAKQFEKIATPVWQMIYLSVIATVFLVFAAYVLAPLFLTSKFMNSFEYTYYKWNNLVAPLMVFLTALSAFYIGQGKTQAIKWLSILGNGVNILLDPLFIFGYKNYLPSMGIMGAALATGAGLTIQLVILSVMIFSKRNREKFGIKNYKFNPYAFISCIKIGISPACFVLIELLGWAIFYKFMEFLSPKHILVSSIIQSFLILFNFFGMGLEKGAGAISGNLIGSNKQQYIPKLFLSGLKLTMIFASVMFFIMVTFPDILVAMFLKNSESLFQTSLGVHLESFDDVYISLKSALLVPK